MSKAPSFNPSKSIPSKVPTYIPSSTPSLCDVWEQIGEIDGLNAGDNFGNAVSISSDGTILAIGSNKYNTNNNAIGRVQVYIRSSDNQSWTTRGSPINGENAGDKFGHSVSLSGDGNILASSAKQYGENNEDLKGKVRIFSFNNSTANWNQLGVDIIGEANDESGSVVALSSDGSVVAIGSPGNANRAGVVRAYTFQNNSWTQQGNDIIGNLTMIVLDLAHFNL